MKIRVLRVLEYTYNSLEKALEDRKTWEVQGSKDFGSMSIQSLATLPTPESQACTRAEILQALTQEKISQLDQEPRVHFGFTWILDALDRLGFEVVRKTTRT